jgi:hypothetical protein
MVAIIQAASVLVRWLDVQQVVITREAGVDWVNLDHPAARLERQRRGHR